MLAVKGADRDFDLYIDDLCSAVVTVDGRPSGAAPSFESSSRILAIAALRLGGSSAPNARVPRHARVNVIPAAKEWGLRIGGKVGQHGVIRMPGPCLPKAVLYQAERHSDAGGRLGKKTSR